MFYLGTSVAPDFPVELSGGYGSREETIERFATFAVASTFQLPSANSYPAYHGQGPLGMRNVITHMSTDPARDFRVRCVNGFSSDAEIDRPLFEKARRTNYLTVIGDPYIATFYHTIYLLNITTNHLALTSVDRFVGEDPESNDVRDHRYKAMERVFNTFMTLVTSATFISWANQGRPIKVEAVPAPIPAAAVPIPAPNGNEARLRVLEEENLRSTSATG